MSKFTEQLSQDWAQSVERFQNSKLYQDAEARYVSLSDNGRVLVNVGALLLVLLLTYRLIVAPAMSFFSDAKQDYQKNLADYEWMEAKKPEVQNLLEKPQSTREGSMLAVASNTAKKYSVNFSKFEPMEGDRVRLWLDSVEFNNLVSWLGELEKSSGIGAVDISIDSAQPGYVSARLTLQG